MSTYLTHKTFISEFLFLACGLGLIYRGITIGLATEHQWQWNYEPGYWNGTYPDGNWVDGAGITVDLDPIPYIVITILLLHLPNLIMALITTVDRNNIIINHMLKDVDGLFQNVSHADKAEEDPRVRPTPVDMDKIQSTLKQIGEISGGK